MGNACTISKEVFVHLGHIDLAIVYFVYLICKFHSILSYYMAKDFFVIKDLTIFSSVVKTPLQLKSLFLLSLQAFLIGQQRQYYYAYSVQ